MASFTTRSESLAPPPADHGIDIDPHVLNACSFLTVIQSTGTYMQVKANADGSFRWVFLVFTNTPPGFTVTGVLPVDARAGNYYDAHSRPEMNEFVNIDCD